MRTRYVIVRGDDFGMCHGVNLGVLRAHREGVLTCTTVMTPCPWFFEAAQIARENPDLEVGLHVTLASEWDIYRWAPVAGPSAVPSLAQSDGTLHKSVDDLAANLSAEDVRTEVTAQLHRALDSGIDVKFMDMHIGVGKYPGARETVNEVINEVADKHGLVFEAPRRLGLKGIGYYTQPIENRIEFVKQKLLEDGPDLRMMLAHPGTRCPELSALQSKNLAVHCKDQGENRGADTDLLCDPEFRTFLDAENIRLVGLGEMIAQRLKG